MIISLTGFKGAGKSSVAEALGMLLETPVFDLDRLIEKEYGDIETLIYKEGEKHFRLIEFQTLEELLFREKDNFILSLGGGTILNPESLGLIHNNTRCVYLDIPYEIALERIGNYRKYAIFSRCRNRGGIRRIYEKRLPLYEAAAEFKVDSYDRSIRETAVEIIHKLHSRVNP
ncbi:MAG: hypothetical protein LKK19_04115 [Bacteroidales bacterium]|jgi:shikimate kinase|nr:hypothetical protein [Bacteroidales bacterium]MCI2121869.1 hypothetical protein [Bacteroidales bacterium]MCI2145713.1 hypothetical protein [Bacteroidales bacterium]